MLSELLEGYHHSQARAGREFLNDVVEMYDKGAPQFCEALNSPGLWGGSGSVFDLILQTGSQIRRSDNALKNQLLKQLLVEMIQANIASPQAASRVADLEFLISARR